MRLSRAVKNMWKQSGRPTSLRRWARGVSAYHQSQDDLALREARLDVSDCPTVERVPCVSKVMVWAEDRKAL